VKGGVVSTYIYILDWTGLDWTQFISAAFELDAGV
jgi:hypothetical protein